MSRPSSAGGAGGGLGAGKAGGNKHGGSGGAAAAAAAAVASAAGVSGSVAGSGSVPAAAVALPAPALPGQSAELTALFECPVCFDYVLPPILQCQAGHLVCNQCRQKLSCCPTCRGPLTPSIRNLAMEKVASTLPFPCKYASAGCLLSLHHSEKPEHEEVCEFRPYTCPCPGASCKWQGSLEAVMPHLMHLRPLRVACPRDGSPGCLPLLSRGEGLRRTGWRCIHSVYMSVQDSLPHKEPH
uniref:RING-type E3 ubiquitin transferase n=1 Tax=Electrophorus electricus TaxID=8005 RepID=A0AAY5F5E3_ELEEL